MMYVIRKNTGKILDVITPDRRGEYPEQWYIITETPTERQLKEWRWDNKV